MAPRLKLSPPTTLLILTPRWREFKARESPPNPGQSRLHDKQSRGFDQTLQKATRQLGVVAERLSRGKTRKARDKVEAEIVAILSPRWIARVMTTTLTGKMACEGTPSEQGDTMWSPDQEHEEAPSNDDRRWI